MKDLNYFKRVVGYIFLCIYLIGAISSVLTAVITAEWYYIGYALLCAFLAAAVLYITPKTAEYLKYCSECEEITEHTQITRTLCECSQCGHINKI